MISSEVFAIFDNFYFQVGERIRVILDCDDNTLSFEKNYEFLGVAFRGMIFYHIFEILLSTIISIQSLKQLYHFLRFLFFILFLDILK